MNNKRGPTMAQGASIHIGMNNIDLAAPAYVGVQAPPLMGCWNDANSMETIAAEQGFDPRLTLLDGAATADRVLGELSTAASNLVSGDILLLTYSGHGSQVTDNSSDEADGQDETWCLWDRMLTDDELSQCFDAFQQGVRIALLSDSCHSGTVSRMLYAAAPRVRGLAEEYASLLRPVQHAVATKSAGAGQATLRPTSRSPAPREVLVRSLTPAAAAVAAANHRRLGLPLRTKAFRSQGGATVVQISGCQDNQLSADGANNGLFTERLLTAWAGGTYTGSYTEFHEAILANMPPTQSPNYLVTGPPNAAFEAERPFTINPWTPVDSAQEGNTEGEQADEPWDSGESSQPGSDQPWEGEGGSVEEQPWWPSNNRTEESGNGPEGERSSGAPIVVGPTRVSRSGGPPSFKVQGGANRHYAVEFATEPRLFAPDAPGRSDGTFYASYSDPSAPPRYTQSTYTLPESAWAKLRGAPRLHYRVCTSATPTGWEGYLPSSADDATAFPTLVID